MHNLPVIDGSQLVIHLVDKAPVMVSCSSCEKLTSLQLAIEYALLLGRACCREVKIPNQYGGVILWCLFMYRIDS